MVRRPLHLEIFATSLGGLLLEIAYTRVFSFKVFYYFTYLVLGIGLLGIGAGGIALAVSERLRRVETSRLVAGAALFAAASVLGGWFVIAPLEVDIAGQVSSASEVGKLVLVGLTLTSAFFGVGLAISAILSADPSRAASLYAVDLAGAALGCTAAVPLVSAIGPPRMVMLAGLILALGALRSARGSRLLLGGGVALAVSLAVPTFLPDLLDDPVVARTKQYEEYRKAGLVRYSRWSPVFRVDVVDHPFQPGDLFILFHDGQPGSGLRRFDGNFERFEYLQKDTRALPFDILPRRPKVLIIGAAGGHEVVTSLYFDAEHVTGVELNPVTHGIVTNAFADISGHLAENPRVTYLNGDGRWFLKQTTEKFDLVWFVAPDSYAAMNSGTSGAFVLSESYLYTVEMVEESLKHLTDRGVVCTQFGELAIERKPNRTTRYLTTAREAFRNLGVTDFGKHVALASAPGFPPFVEVAVLLSRSPMTAEQS
ncbi:MAG: hypothetical protein FJ104_01280, partial [Deltaproteobacteria bacterium]|nr:hypothetical protein [Deltaproteobacteria bacterium]